MPKKKKSTPYGLPDTLWLCNQEWTVHYVDSVSRDEVLQGACDARDRAIYLDQNLSREALTSTLIHEAGHAMIAMNPIQVGLSEDQEEAIVVWFEHAVIDLLRANDIKI